MNTWTVKLPIAGVACVEVQAESEAEAIDEAIRDVRIADIEQFEAYRDLAQRDVCIFSVNEASAKAIRPPYGQAVGDEGPA